jgi:hypothetical protein
MKATIIGVNLNRGRAVATTSNGEYVLLELSTDEPELYDEVSGNFDEHPFGGKIIRNITSGMDMDVYIQDYCSETMAYEYLNGL